MTENDHFGSKLEAKIPLCLIIIGRFCSLMKRQTSVAMYGIIFAATMALGMVSVSGFSQSLFVASTDMKAVNQMDMMGHITLTATDQDGNILSYIQTDNIIVNVGENCVAESIFNVTTTGTDLCDGTGTQTGANNNGVADGGFTLIAIGINNTAAAATDQALGNSTSEVSRQSANSTSVVSSTGTGAGSKAVVTLTGIFTATGTPTIVESGIFDKAQAADENMLARQVFTGIPLTAGDKLTVEWEITIGS